MRCIIHIGHGKTGSSAIQSYLSNATDGLKKLGYEYPYHRSFDEARKGKTTSGNGTLLLDENFRIGSDMILSNESLSRRLASDEAIENLIQRLGVKPKVILYTRNLFEFLGSCWGQTVKRGGLHTSYSDFLMDRFDPHHPRVLYWLGAAQKFGFELSVKNYSNHKKHIVQHFLETAIGTEAETLIKSSPIEEVVVNRSLTVSEYKVQSLLNKYVNFPTSRFVSDVWVNELPNIASESPLINKKAYDITVERLSDCINQINTMIEPQEAIQIESYEDLQFTKKGRSEEIFEFTSEQLEILIQGVSRRMSSPIKNEKKNHEKQSHLGSRSWTLTRPLKASRRMLQSIEVMLRKQLFFLTRYIWRKFSHANQKRLERFIFSYFPIFFRRTDRYKAWMQASLGHHGYSEWIKRHDSD